MVSFASQTMFADLLQRCLDAEFDEAFSPADGYFRKHKRGNRYYWYFVTGGRAKKLTYVGPVTDKSITDRVSRFEAIKSDFRERQSTVRALAAAGLPAPDGLTGRIIEAMHDAGFFRLRGVLVGTVAFQCYAGILAIDMARDALQTGDADFAQFWGISENIDDAMPPVLEVLQGVDPTFVAVPSINDPLVTAKYRNTPSSGGPGYIIDILTPNRGSDGHAGRMAKMKALGGSGAQPLRHLDDLIHEPERSVLLYGAGVPVSIPRAERFAIHKLIVAVERRDQAKAAKDVRQASILIEALAVQRPGELALAHAEALAAGPKWRDKLEAGMLRLPSAAQEKLDACAAAWAKTRRGQAWWAENGGRGAVS